MGEKEQGKEGKSGNKPAFAPDSAGKKGTASVNNIPGKSGGDGARKIMWCQWDVSPVGEPFKPCNNPVVPESIFCSTHVERLPLWPQ